MVLDPDTKLTESLTVGEAQMPQKNSTELIDFAKLSLSRNDESVRFSESKAAFLFTFVGLLLGLLTDKLSTYSQIINGAKSHQWLIAWISLILLGIGTVTVIISALLIVFPRLKVTKQSSHTFFGSINNLSEHDFHQSFTRLDAPKILEDLISQIYATSAIARRKFFLVQVELAGTVAVILGWLLVFTMSFLFP